MTSEVVKCELCGEPMPPGEQMFKFHGYSGPCPKPPLPRDEPAPELSATPEALAMMSADLIELREKNAALESELAALRQIVADVETCRGAMNGSVNVLVDYSLDAKHPCIVPDIENVPARGVVRVVPANSNFPTQEYWGDTWQAALHAAAEHVRNTNPERTGT